MTRVEVFLTNKGYTGFTVSGHSGYAEEGSDIVCAAVSSVVSFAASLLENACDGFTFDSNPEKAFVSLKITPNQFGDPVIQTLFEQLDGIAADFGKYLSVTLKRF